MTYYGDPCAGCEARVAALAEALASKSWQRSDEFDFETHGGATVAILIGRSPVVRSAVGFVQFDPCGGGCVIEASKPVEVHLPEDLMGLCLVPSFGPLAVEWDGES